MSESRLRLIRSNRSLAALCLVLAGFLAALLQPSVADAQSYVLISSRLGLLRGLPDRPDEILFGALAGTLFAAGCYVFFIWAAIRDRSHIYLVLMLVSLGFNLAVNTPAVLDMLHIQETVRVVFAHMVSFLVFEIGACFFSIHFLETELYAPILTRIIRATVLILCLIIILTGVDTFFINWMMPLIAFAVCALLLFAGLRAIFNHIPGSFTHVVAFSILLVGGLSAPLHELGLVPQGILGENLFYLATAITSLLFSIGIAGQFSSRQDEKERALTRSNERFALAALGSHDGLYDWNIPGRYLYVSERLRRILGQEIKSGEDAVRQWYDLIVPDDRRMVKRNLVRFLKGRATTIALEYRIKNADGSNRWLYSTGVARRDPETYRVLRLVGSTGDVTGKKSAEFALRASEARFRSIAEAHPVPVMIAHIGDSRVLYASPGVSKALGAPLSEIVGRGSIRFFVNEDERRAFVSEIVSTGRVDLRELSLRRADGSLLPAAISGRLIDYQGQSAVVLGIYDLTERKTAEAEIAQQRQALERSERMAALGSLLAGVAHELNNPLSIVVGQSSLLFETTVDAKTKTRAEKIQKAAERCTRIVRNFLALARRKEPERNPISLVQVVHGSIELFMGQIRQNNVTLIEDFMPDPPLVNADPDQMHQVASNLLVNAIQAFEPDKDGRQIKIRVATLPTNPKEIELSVIDNGPGVPDKIKARIFEPFFTTKQAGKGTGIGLSLCLSIIEGHGGRFVVGDTPGGGATFSMILPVLSQQAIAEVKKAKVEEESIVLPPQHVLIVDDEVEVGQILADLLQKDNHTMAMAENGAVALDMLKKERFDFIISDLRMPVMDGPHFYAALKAQLPQYVPRIFFVTGDTLSDHVRDFLTSNPVQVVDKPYMAPDIRAALAKQIAALENAAPPPKSQETQPQAV